MRKVFGALALGAILTTPLALRADDHGKHRERIVTYYDRDGHDRHEWNEREERAYRHWLEQERKREYRAWKHASKRDQREYWRWRHANPDWR